MKISEAILRAMSPGNEYSDHRTYAEVKKYVECSREAVLDTLDGLDSEGLVARGYTYDYAGTKWPCWVLTERGRRALERAELEPTQPSPQTVKLSCALARCVGVLEAIAGSEPYDDPVGHLARMRDFAKREAEAASRALAQVTSDRRKDMTDEQIEALQEWVMEMIEAAHPDYQGIAEEYARGAKARFVRLMQEAPAVSAQEDFGSPASVDRFRVLASSFTAAATSSKEAAVSVLRREGIVTAEGNLTKHYSSEAKECE